MSNYKKLKTKRQTQPTKNPIMLSIKQKCKRKKKKKCQSCVHAQLKKQKKKQKNPKRKQRQHGEIKGKKLHMSNFVQFLHHFVSNLERLCFGRFGRKHTIPTKIFPIFHPQPNNHKPHFLCTFLSKNFHPSNNHFNQTEP